MEEDPVARIEQQDGDREQRRSPPEAACSEEPRRDRRRVQERDARLGQRAAQRIEQPTDDERRDRRAAEHVAEVDRVRLEELDVGAEVRSEVPSADERQRERLEPPHADRDEEDDERRPARLRRGGGAVGLTQCLAEPAHDPTG